MSEIVEEYDDRGNLVYHKDSVGVENWMEYDEDNSMIHYKTSDNWEEWYEYENGIQTKITEKEFEEAKFKKEQKEFLNREQTSRFELMELGK